MPSNQDEFAEIFEPTPNRPVLSRPPRQIASYKLIRDTRAELDLIGIQLDDDQAREIADWLADKLDRFAAMPQPLGYAIAVPDWPDRPTRRVLSLHVWQSADDPGMLADLTDMVDAEEAVTADGDRSIVVALIPVEGDDA